MDPCRPEPSPPRGPTAEEVHIRGSLHGRGHWTPRQRVCGDGHAPGMTSDPPGICRRPPPPRRPPAPSTERRAHGESGDPCLRPRSGGRSGRGSAGPVLTADHPPSSDRSALRKHTLPPHLGLLRWVEKVVPSEVGCPGAAHPHGLISALLPTGVRSEGSGRPTRQDLEVALALDEPAVGGSGGQHRRPGTQRMRQQGGGLRHLPL